MHSFAFHLDGINDEVAVFQMSREQLEAFITGGGGSERPGVWPGSVGADGSVDVGGVGGIGEIVPGDEGVSFVDFGGKSGRALLWGKGERAGGEFSEYLR